MLGRSLCRSAAISARVRSATYLQLRPKSTLDEVAQLVPQSRRVVLIDQKTVQQDYRLDSIKLRPNQRLQIVNINPREGQDPKVAIKVVSLENDSGTAHKKEKKKKKKPAEIKELPVSWTISPHDLDTQKSQALQSVLSRGHHLQIQLKGKKRRRGPLTPAELESRRNLVERLKNMALEHGTEAKLPLGSVDSQMTLFYSPKSSQ